MAARQLAEQTRKAAKELGVEAPPTTVAPDYSYREGELQVSSHMQNFIDCVRSRELPRCHVDRAFEEAVTLLMSLEVLPARREGPLGPREGGDRLTRGRRPGDDRLISGKLRAKAARSGAAATVVSVDGTSYAWSYRHGWQVWGKGIKAISLSVTLKPGRTRELILDLTMTLSSEDGAPPEARIVRALEDAVRSAREAGWDPESRGRAFRHEVAGPIS